MFCVLKFHIKCLLLRMLTFLVLSTWKFPQTDIKLDLGNLLNSFFDYFFLFIFSILFLELLLFGCWISWYSNFLSFLSYSFFCLSFCFVWGNFLTFTFQDFYWVAFFFNFCYYIFNFQGWSFVLWIVFLIAFFCFKEYL